MPDQPEKKPPNPADQYDPKTDEKVDLLQRELHGNLYTERSLLENLDEKEKDLEKKLEELEAAKKRIIHPLD